VGTQLRVERQERSPLDQNAAERVVLLVGSVAPLDPIGLEDAAPVLDPIEGLTPAEQKRGDNYLTLMRRNLAALRKALACR